MLIGCRRARFSWNVNTVVFARDGTTLGLGGCG
jgi:hypothetical protein